MRPPYNASIEEWIRYLEHTLHRPAEPPQLHDALRHALRVIEELQSELMETKHEQDSDSRSPAVE